MSSNRRGGAVTGDRSRVRFPQITSLNGALPVRIGVAAIDGHTVHAALPLSHGTKHASFFMLHKVRRLPHSNIPWPR
jgi:hypothetical protein